MPSLVLVDERVLGKSLDLGTGEYVIGRGADCAFVLDGKEISRKHARVRFNGSGYVVEDLGSKNGTRVNGRPITSTPLKHADEIAIGDFTIVFDDGRGIEGVRNETHVEQAGEATKSLHAGFDAIARQVHRPEQARVVGQVRQRTLKERRKHKKMANEDRLTGVSNRRLFDERITALVALAKKHANPLSLIFVDLDHFKAVNDTHGHAKGDEVLKGIARIIREGCRGDDFVARYGGEEFVLLLENTTTRDAAAVAEALRRTIGERSEKLFTFRITASFGVATYPDHAADEASLIRKADEAVYEAKASGRNRVITSHG